MSQSKLELTEEGRKNGIDRDTLPLLNSQKGMKWHTNRVIDKVEGTNMVSMGSGSPSLNLVALLFITKTLTHPLSVSYLCRLVVPYFVAVLTALLSFKCY